MSIHSAKSTIECHLSSFYAPCEGKKREKREEQTAPAPCKLICTHSKHFTLTVKINWKVNKIFSTSSWCSRRIGIIITREEHPRRVQIHPSLQWMRVWWDLMSVRLLRQTGKHGPAPICIHHSSFTPWHGCCSIGTYQSSMEKRMNKKLMMKKKKKNETKKMKEQRK